MGDLVFFDNAPPHARVGPRGQTFVHDGGHAGDQRAIDDVAVPHHPADVAGGKVGLAGLGIEDVLHAGSQRHGIATGVALHSLGLAGGTAGVERVAGVRGFHPLARHGSVQVLCTQRRPVMVTARVHGGGHQAPVHHENGGRLVAGQRNRFIQQWLVRHAFAATRAGIGADDGHGLSILDARGERARGKTAKHHRMQRANAHAGQHGKGGLGNHGHVDEHAVALLHPQALQHGGHALHFGVQFGKAVAALGVGFGGNGHQRRLAGTVFQVAIYRVMTQVGGAANKPFRKRRIAVVADLLR